MVDVWTALISGGTALGGVLIANIWQGHREDKRWKREDRYRFVEHKRELYADFLGRLDEWIREIQPASVSRLIGVDPTKDWIHTIGDNKRKEVALAQDRLRLISDTVWKATNPVTQKLDHITSQIHETGREPDAKEWSAETTHRNNLIKVMKKDLGVVEDS
ncbi:hypothetical protein [Saccharothrix hoggarensis]|uniref:Uncharacterized protein n=1 Tax=Saccharothrix hoggarensis TaxID=913853 RepID=A0ABW3QTB4_9PSEU